MVGRYCCVPGCKSSSIRNPGVTFNPFPKNDIQRSEWIRLILLNASGNVSNVSKRRPWSTPVIKKDIGHKSHTVCGFHFNKSGKRSISEKYPTYFGNLLDVSTLGLSHDVEIYDDTREDSAIKLIVGDLISPNLPTSKSEINSYDHNYNLDSDPAILVNIIKTQKDDIFNLRSRLDELVAENLSLKSNLEELQNCVQQMGEVNAENTRLNNLISSLKMENLQNKSKAKISEKKLKLSSRFSLKSVSQCSEKLKFYTGCQNLDCFNDLFEYIEPDLKNLNMYTGARSYKRKHERNGFNESGCAMSLSFKDQLFMVLCRLKVGLLEEDLSYRFQVSITTVSNVCTTWIDLLEKRLTNLRIWPSRIVVDEYMPKEFKIKFPKTRLVIDTSELFIQKPSDFKTQSDTCSSYKTHNTAKGLIGITPNGFISFISDLVPGHMSDQDLTEECGLLELLDPGDSVMADRGFLIEDLLLEKGVSLNMLPFLGNKAQLSIEEEKTTREIASVRIHVERVISSLKSYHILSSIFPNSMHNQLDKIWKICAHLVNFCNEPLLDG